MSFAFFKRPAANLQGLQRLGYTEDAGIVGAQKSFPLVHFTWVADQPKDGVWGFVDIFFEKMVL